MSPLSLARLGLGVHEELSSMAHGKQGTWLLEPCTQITIQNQLEGTCGMVAQIHLKLQGLCKDLHCPLQKDPPQTGNMLD
jgi:hypothetical protein